MQAADLATYLVDPTTGEKLRWDGQALLTASGKKYPASPQGKPDLIGIKTEEFSSQRDGIDRMKASFKKLLGRSYVMLVRIIAPVMPRIHWGTFQTYWHYIVKKRSAGKELVIQVGSGNDRISERIVNIDIFDLPGTDLIADCTRLPFADNSVDGVLSMAVLEHVENPSDFLKEAHRVLKPGGFIITGVPFMQGYHASPSDHTRWTHQGLGSWHRSVGFEQEQIVANAGPTSSLLWILQEWLSIFLSFGITPLYYLWWGVFTVTLFPVKLLDLLLIYYPQSYRINSFNIYIGRKA